MDMTPPDDTAWNAWSPEQLAAKLSGVRADWYVVGGWALDLWLGKQTRNHEDLEFAVSPKTAPQVASCLSELQFFEAKSGKLVDYDPTHPIPYECWQFWGADREHRCWRVDMMMERGTDDTWIYKRDPRLQQPRYRAIRTSKSGIRYLAPANVLLFKAKQCRPKDQRDFDTCLPKLSGHDRACLREWLQMCHPNHKWLDQL